MMRTENGVTGIMTAMPEETAAIAGLFNADPEIFEVDQRVLAVGEIGRRAVVIVESGVGKVRAAHTAALLIHRFDTSSVLFTGVAGSTTENTELGDIVIADAVCEHDVWYGTSGNNGTGYADALPTDPDMAALLIDSARESTGKEPASGLVVTGDQFIDHMSLQSTVLGKFPSAIAVEMEGAAVGRVCTEASVPFGVLRAISDASDGTSPEVYETFLSEQYPAIVSGIVNTYLDQVE